MLKSALTAQLAGGSASTNTPTPALKTFLDPVAFPCVAYAAVTDADIGISNGETPAAPTVAEELVVDAELLKEAASVQLAGSLPTATRTADGVPLVRS
jgi:hypothetical protein